MCHAARDAGRAGIIDRRMKCPACDRSMTALFLTYACDYCDGLVDEGVLDRGFVVWRDRPLPGEEHVFPSRVEAERWRALRGLDGCPIREVRSRAKFFWQKSTGVIKGIEMADRPIAIFPDQRYPDGPHRAHLVDEAFERDERGGP